MEQSEAINLSCLKELELKLNSFEGRVPIVLIDDEPGIDVCRNALKVMFVCYDKKPRLW
jgi:hypothetical protein